MEQGTKRALGLLVALSVAASAPVLAVSKADSAMALCHQAAEAPDSEKEELLEQGLELAEAAVEAEPKNARAHLAHFCNLGTRLKSEGVGFSTLSKLRKLVQVIDRAMELGPDDPEILAAKGAMLVELPGMFGGDAAKGEKMLRRALSIDPENDKTREYLAKALEASGRYRLAELVRRAKSSPPEQ